MRRVLTVIAGGALALSAAGGPGVVADAPLGVQLFRTGITAAEPTLGVRDGRVYVLALHQSRTPAVETHRILPIEPAVLELASGGQWRDVSPKHGPRHAHVTSSDPYLHVDELTGRVFAADLGSHCSMVSFSDDPSGAWTTNRMACGGNGGRNDDHPTVFTGPPRGSQTSGYPNVVYYCAQDHAEDGAYCAKSLDGGLTFALTGSPAYPQPCGTTGSIHGHGVTSRAGTIYLPKADYCGQPHVAISGDEGRSWQHVAVAKGPGDGSHEASVAVAPDGTVYYLYMRADRLPYLVRSHDGGRTWSLPRPIAPTGLRASALPSLDVGSDGRVVAAYLGTTNAPKDLPASGSCGFVVEVTTGCAESPEVAATAWHGYVAMEERKGGRLRTTRVTPAEDPLIRGACGPSRCKAVFDFIDVVAAADGAAWVALVDACTRESCTKVGEGLVARVRLP